MLKMKSENKNGKRARNRKGAAVVEFAVCLPVILLIVLGSIEAASMMFLRQALVQSAYEGAKVAIRNNGNNADANAAIQAVAAGRRINQLTVTFEPADVSTVAQGDTVRVTITAPGDTNSFIPFGPFKNKLVAAQAVMVKE
jgi:Flp pilus assembly protein TadG